MCAQLSTGHSVTAKLMTTKFVFIILCIICVCCQRLPERFGYCCDCGSNAASKHDVNMRRVRRRIRFFSSSFFSSIHSNDLGFIFAGVSNMGGYKRNA